MLARAGTAKKAASKFEDSDSTHMSRPRIMSDLPHRQAPRVPARLRTAAAEASGARHRGLVAGRGTSPRSPMNEKKQAAAGSACGAGSRVAELELKLGKAHDQLAGMREQLATAEKTRKDARAAFVEAKKRFSLKQRDVTTSAPDQDNDDDHAPAEHKQHAAAATDYHVMNGCDDVIRSMGSPATGVLEQILSESGNKRGQVDEQVEKNSDDGEEVNNNVADGEGKKGSPEDDQLRSKLAAKDREVYEVRAKLMVKDMEVKELKMNMTARDTAVEELTSKLVAKDTEIAALRAHNADLRKTASEAAETARETTAAKAREIEHALMMDSAAREDQLAERLAASERAREALEAEARRSRVQSEQWRKAAEEAASVLGGAPGDKDMRRHDSVGSGGRNIDDEDAKGEGSGGKRKSGGAVRLLADMWKKKSPK